MWRIWTFSIFALSSASNPQTSCSNVARETGKTIPQLALNWLLGRPTVASVIIGAHSEDQLRENIAATGWNLAPEHIALLDAASAEPKIYPYWHQAGFSRNPTPVD